jgi:hypothetical protein
VNLLLVSEVAVRLRAREATTRRILDRYFADRIHKVGAYRAIPSDLLPAIAAKLRDPARHKKPGRPRKTPVTQTASQP